MSFLDKPLSEMSLSDIQRLISVEVSAQIPPIPAGLRDLSNLDQPLILPDVNVNGQVLTYNSASNTYQPKTITSATGVTDAGTPSTPAVTLIAGPGWIQATWAASTGTSDPLAYKVFIRAGAAPTTADNTYLVGTTRALSLVMNTLADGTTQIGPPSTVYHVKVIAVSALSGGGTSAASTDVTGSPAAIDGVVTTFTNIDAGTITAGQIAAARMETNFLTAAQATITALSSIVANIGTITSGTITGTLIQTAAVNSARLVMDGTSLRSLAVDNSTIWAVSAATGQFTTGNHASLGTDLGGITAGTITGATTQTAASGKRVVLNSSGITVYGDDGSTVVISIPTAAGVDATFAGALSLTSDVVQPLFTAGLAVSAGGSLTGTTTYFLSYSWYDGTNETQPCPVNSATTTGTNKTITITIPKAPRPNLQARVYMNTVTFGAGGGKLQTAAAASRTATTAIAITSFNNAGAASKSSNTMTYVSAQVKPATQDASGNDYGFILAGDGRIRHLGPTINLQFFIYEEFLGGALFANPFVETIVGTGSGALGTGTTQVNPGVVQLSTGTTTTGSDTVRTNNNTITLGTARVRCSYYFNVDTALPGGASGNFNIQLGLSDTNDATTLGTAANHGVAFCFSSTSSALFGLRTNANPGGVAHTTFTQAVDVNGANFSAVAGTYYFAEFEVNAGATSIDWWINGVKQTAITADIPIGNAMAFKAGITKASSTTAATLKLDAMALYGDFAS